MYSGPKVTLPQLLDSREQRAFRQREWLNEHSLPLISFTINMVGEVKQNTIAERAFNAGYQEILDECLSQDMAIVRLEKYTAVTGYELLIVAQPNEVKALKRAMVSIEDTHPLGRLFDIDVIDIDGRPLSRDSLGLPRRRCLVCEDEAKVCARSRRHSLSDLIAKMSEIIDDCQ